MKIIPRKFEFDESAKSLVQKVISELPQDFIDGIGQATAHLSQADGGTIKIYPTPGTRSRITEVHFPEGAVVTKADYNSTSFEYKDKKFLLVYD